jgi:hypothetical protein
MPATQRMGVRDRIWIRYCSVELQITLQLFFRQKVRLDKDSQLIFLVK